MAGSARLLECIATETFASLAVADRTQPAAPIPWRRQQMLNGVLLGHSSKQIAIELGVAPSTVAADVRLGLEALGVSASASRVPLPLALLAHATHYPALNRFVVQTGCTRQGLTCQVFHAPLVPLDRSLSPALSAVVYQLALGRTYKEIADSRRTSPRTIANQLSQAFKTLGISGRPGVLSYLGLNASAEDIDSAR
ncbi:MAG TPA: hypothetical protein VGC79_32835 [Polyangiaceae bacterium]